MSTNTLNPQTVIEQLAFSSGQSDVGHLNKYHPVNLREEGDDHRANSVLTPLNSTIEYYRGADAENVDHIGVVATKFTDAGIPNERQFVDVSAGIASNGYVELSMANASFGPHGELAPLAKALGLAFSAEEVDDKKIYKVVMLERPEDINSRLEALGINDRRFVGFAQGVFDVQTYLQHLTKHEIPMGMPDVTAVHDRAFHLLGHVMVVPEVLDFIAAKSADLLSGFKAAEAALGGRPLDMFDGDELKNYYKARDVMRTFVSKLDYDLPNLSLRYTGDSTKDWTTARYHLRELGIDDKQLEVMATKTVDWVASLRHRAASLHR